MAIKPHDFFFDSHPTEVIPGRRKRGDHRESKKNLLKQDQKGSKVLELVTRSFNQRSARDPEDYYKGDPIADCDYPRERAGDFVSHRKPKPKETILSIFTSDYTGALDLIQMKISEVFDALYGKNAFEPKRSFHVSLLYANLNSRHDRANFDHAISHVIESFKSTQFITQENLLSFVAEGHIEAFGTRSIGVKVKINDDRMKKIIDEIFTYLPDEQQRKIRTSDSLHITLGRISEKIDINKSEIDLILFRNKIKMIEPHTHVITKVTLQAPGRSDSTDYHLTRRYTTLMSE